MRTKEHTNRAMVIRKAVSILIMAMFILIIISMMRMTAASGQVSGEETAVSEESVTSVRYINIQIHAGDTLWDLSCEYKPDDMTVRQYMKQVRKINRMDDNQLTACEYLIIPIYEE